jgi:hypothetical protein
LHTNAEWHAVQDDSVQMARRQEWNYALGPPFLVLNETVDGRKQYPGWRTGATNVQLQWPRAKIMKMGSMMLPVLEPWKLVERPIPQLTQIYGRFSKAVCCSESSRLDQWSKMIGDGASLKIQPNTKAWVELEAQQYTTAYIELKCQAGPGSRVQILCAECYEAPMPRTGPGVQRKKNDRTDHVNGKLYGPVDTYITHEGDNVYEPFWFKAFRYVRLEIETSDKPVILQDINFRETYYPLDISTRIGLSGKFGQLWDVSINTLRNCMHETYEDCPFYEQNQFLMDSRLQMLFTYQLSRDDRLARKTMREFHASQREDGLLVAQFPSPGRTVNIPMFSLFFIPMVHDHMRYFGDKRLVRQYLATVDGILNYFDGILNDQGLVGDYDPDDWAFVDWVREWQGRPLHGMAVPPAYHTGPATIHSLIYAWALQMAADLARFIGRNDTATEYQQRASSIINVVKNLCFDGMFFTDGPHSNALSQHCQVFAILAGAVDRDVASMLMRKMLEAEMPKCSYAMSFYVFRAAAQAGLYEELWQKLIAPWHHMINQKLVTFAEDDLSMRSDCHGWAATPIYEIVAEVFGLQPGEKGGVIHLSPKAKILPQGSEGRFVTPHGPLLLNLKEGEIHVQADFDGLLLFGSASQPYMLRRGQALCLPIPRG